MILEAPDLRDPKTPAEVSQIRGKIEFCDVSFHYPSRPDADVLKEISLTIEPGTTVALVGESGAGKSTIAALIPRFYDVSSGSIRIDGIDVRDFAQKDLRSRIGIVQQSAFLFDVSIRENILFGRPDASDEEVREAARRANVLNFVESLPNGFDTQTGERGVKLSGGQRRRIDIARALLHRPEILILDEPTTGLDPQTRSLLWRVVRELRESEGMTVFLTTHYMEEAADADYVVILDHGKIAAEGTPLTLKNTYTGDFITLYGVSEADVQALGAPYTAIRDAFRVAVPDTAAATGLILAHPALFRDYEITKGKMDDVFLAVTGKKLTGGEDK